jgi:hypothetical protein
VSDESVVSKLDEQADRALGMASLSLQKARAPLASVLQLGGMIETI